MTTAMGNRRSGEPEQAWLGYVIDASQTDWPEHATISWASLVDQVVERGPVLVVVGGQRLVVCRQEHLLDGAVVALGAGLTSSETSGRSGGRELGRGTPRGLTPRQREVAQLAVEGWPAVQIGLHLGIATQTVRVHLNAVRAHYRADSVAEALRTMVVSEGSSLRRHG